MRSYGIIPGRFARDIFICWFLVALSILATKQFGYWFYPIACVIIANRQLTLLLLTHESVHWALIKNRKWNDWIGFYFCAAPSLISLKKYRRLHHFHHFAVGDVRKDPDLQLYSAYPMPLWKFILRSVLGILSLKIAVSFFSYLTEWPEALSGRKTLKGKIFVFSKESDFIAFNLVFLATLAILISTHHLMDYVLFFLVPLIVVMQPYALLGGAMQHGPLKDHLLSGEKSRTIAGPKWLMEIFFPLDINFHGEHHLNPSVPHYWLRQFSKDLETENKAIVWKESILKASGRLFKNS